MIDKIIKIKGIGLLHDSITRAKKFTKITILYGENGRGKTTLATIFSSLAQNNPSIISVRETLDGTHDPEIEFRINNTTYTYTNGIWNQGCINIVVFDSAFVDANVYSGFEISSDHRRSLLVFTLGEQGVTLKSEVDLLTDQISDQTSKIRIRTTELERICQPLSIREYIDIPEDSNINEKIQTMESFYQSVLNADQIYKNPNLSKITLPILDLSNVKLLLSITLSEISKEAKTRVLDHMATHMNDQDEQWLKEGLSLIKEDNCPFCGQKSAQIIELYQKYFDESYQKHQDELEEHQGNIERCLSDYTLSELFQTCNNNKLLFDNVWSNLLTRKFGYPLSGDLVRRDLEVIRESIQKIIRIKLSKPATAIEDLDSFNSANARYLEILSQIQQYNNEVQFSNRDIESIKNCLKQTNRQQIRIDLDRLIQQKERHSSLNKELCDTFKSLVQGKESLEEQKDQARTRLDSFTNELLELYESEINRYLDCFNSGFRIVNIDTSHEQGHPRMKYQLQIRNQNLVVGSRRQALDRPSFSNTLSDGDKRTLAFSFFMAKNNLDANISDKVLVVDDPISSLDQSRQRATQLALRKLAQKANQIIILSHDPNFLKTFIETGNFNQTELSVYEFKRTQNDYSTLEDCDIEECIQSVYKSSYQLITSYITDPLDINKLSVVRAIRPMIEANLRLRFQDSLKGANSLGKMIELIRSSPQGNPLTKIKPHLQKIEDINSYTTAHTHDTNADGSILQINDVELKHYALLAMDIAQGFINH